MVVMGTETTLARNARGRSTPAAFQKTGVHTTTSQPRTSEPGLSLDRPNNSDKIAAYHGSDKFYSSRPPPATPPQQSKGVESVDEDRKLLIASRGEDANHGDVPVCRPGKQKAEDSRAVLGKSTSFVLEPQRLLITPI